MNRILIKEIFIALGVILVPNLAFLILAQAIGLSRPWLNVDYAAVALLLMVGPFWLAATAFCAFLFFDLAAVVGQMMPFLRLQDALYLSQFLGIAPNSYKAVAVLVLMLAGVSLWLFGRLERWSSRPAVMVVVNLFVYVYVIFVFAVDAPSEGESIWRVNNEKWIASQTVFNVDVRGGGFVKSFRLEGDPFEPSLYDGVTAPLFEVARPETDKILLVVVESWGVSSAPVMADVLEPLLDRKASFKKFKRGESFFSGATVAAELRELCQYHAKHFNLKSAEDGFQSCLPNRLRRAGYDTIGMHGAAGTMYDRAYWYPRAGFEQTIFYETKSWEHRCYSFPGACDFELMAEVPRFFAEVDKGFFYWLTLNSHYFYDNRDIHLDRFDRAKYGMDADPQVCRNLKLQAQFFHYFSKMLERPEMADVEVMIVGDHDPIISNEETYEEYFKKNRVPWIKLRT